MDSVASDRKVWTAVETRALISLKNEMKTRFRSMKRNKKLWVELSERLKKDYGHHRTALQCSIRWKNIMASYKECRESLQREDSPPKTFSFFREVETILGDSPIPIQSLSDPQGDDPVATNPSENALNVIDSASRAIEEIENPIIDNQNADTDDTNNNKKQATHISRKSKDDMLFDLLKQLTETVENHTAALERIETKLSEIMPRKKSTVESRQIPKNTDTQLNYSLAKGHSKFISDGDEQQLNIGVEVADIDNRIIQLKSDMSDEIESESSSAIENMNDNKNNRKEYMNSKSKDRTIVRDSRTHELINESEKQVLPTSVDQHTDKEKSGQVKMIKRVNSEDDQKLVDNGGDGFNLENNHAEVAINNNDNTAYPSPEKSLSKRGFDKSGDTVVRSMRKNDTNSTNDHEQPSSKRQKVDRDDCG